MSSHQMLSVAKEKESTAILPEPKPKPEIVFVLGPPGSGKGTQCKRLANEAALAIYHLSVGDYLRDISNGKVGIEDGMLGGMAYDDFRAHLEQSRLIPGPVVADILAHKVWKEHSNGQFLFVIDGYPRQIDAADEFEKAVGEPRGVVEFICSKEVAKERFLKRKRGNDDEAMFERRYAEYCKNSVAIRARYSEHMRAVVTIGECESVYPRVRDVMWSVIGSLKPPPWALPAKEPVEESSEWAK